MDAQFVRQWVRILGNVEKWFDKAAAYADLKKFDSKVFLSARLAPDQLDLTRQVQIMSDTAKFAVARLTGQEGPKFEDNEQTLDDLRARVRKTIAYLETIKPEALAGAGDRMIQFSARYPDKRLRGNDYFNQHAQPNFYFHATTLYAILRHNGVDLGKMDFLGNMDVKTV